MHFVLYVCFSVCNCAESQRLGALLRWRVFYSVHIARRAFGTHGITDITFLNQRRFPIRDCNESLYFQTINKTTGINVISVVLSTFLTAKRITLRHFSAAQNKELATIADDPFHQLPSISYVKPPRNVMPVSGRNTLICNNKRSCQFPYSRKALNVFRMTFFK